jgi:dTDP-glucose 4,6-dehydratase
MLFIGRNTLDAAPSTLYAFPMTKEKPIRLLVTGGAGFIGSNFIHYWLEQYPQDEIINLDALTYAGNLENLTTITNNPHYTFIQGDIRDPAAVAKAMQNVDLIVHFAAESHVDRSILGPEAFVETNIKGTFVLLEAARQRNIRFHHISTDEVFGALALEDTGKFTEETPYRPSSPYAASKAAADHLVRVYYHTYGLPITITNCSNNFGPYQHPEKFIPRLITNLIDGEPLKLYGDGLYVRDWLYVKDHCRAIDATIRQGHLGETYVVGGMTEDVSNKRVAEIVLASETTPQSQIEFVPDRPGHDRRYSVNWVKIKRELGWQPEHSFEEWLEETVQWYKNNESWWRPLKKQAEAFYQKTKQ